MRRSWIKMNVRYTCTNQQCGMNHVDTDTGKKNCSECGAVMAISRPGRTKTISTNFPTGAYVPPGGIPREVKIEHHN